MLNIGKLYLFCALALLTIELLSRQDFDVDSVHTVLDSLNFTPLISCNLYMELCCDHCATVSVAVCS